MEHYLQPFLFGCFSIFYAGVEKGHYGCSDRYAEIHHGIGAFTVIAEIIDYYGYITFWFFYVCGFYTDHTAAQNGCCSDKQYHKPYE
ncbi:hypothetical protein SDC9_143716 [bioreactor metagenome]|uniref:Uncharacterized protein n=1 Tax=bioreactor metagenome TaxID=1076179 RepID=A0A645E7G3_9ZZZZ